MKIKQIINKVVNCEGCARRRKRLQELLKLEQKKEKKK